MKIAMINAATLWNGPFGPLIGCRKGNALEAIADAYSMHAPDILLCPEFFLYDLMKEPYAKQRKDEIEREIAARTGRGLIIPGTIIWSDGEYVYNTAPIIIDSEVIGECHKATDGGTSAAIENLGYTVKTGSGNGAVISWRNMRIGLEICMDHKLGMLKKSKRKTDLHIVLGCNGELIGENNTARRRLFRKGYMLLCDGFKECRANKGSGEFIDDIQPEKQGNVILYDIEP